MKKTRRSSTILTFAVAMCAVLNAGHAEAQAYTYPSMQLPTVSNRDFTGALSVANGTVAVFQWPVLLSALDKRSCVCLWVLPQVIALNSSMTWPSRRMCIRVFRSIAVSVVTDQRGTAPN